MLGVAEDPVLVVVCGVGGREERLGGAFGETVGSLSRADDMIIHDLGVRVVFICGLVVIAGGLLEGVDRRAEAGGDGKSSCRETI